MHLIRRYGFLPALIFAAQIGFSQTERTVYQVFELDSAQTISFDILGDHFFEEWAGNSVLVETNIQITHASPAIVDYLIKGGRYEVSSDTLSVGEIKIFTKNRDRKPFKTPAGQCTELAKARILIPDTYEWMEKNKLLRRKTDMEMYKQWSGKQ
jgi:hypothetical protein